ncbi:transferase [Acidianus sulfidivorans JP7]|uniref:Transferase n=1 Tax=Acidianus sulfidivorans JP7 TaxID=619593 RepID=A0A2U9IL08_9CREN|nr:transferase [Acidianus sulfidivorans]AWR96706.1 transferase [Acidianus sulfidivorans JP7]
MDGKIPLNGEVYLDGEKVEGAKLFLHVKGYKRARVTHVDIEGDKIRGLIKPRHSVYPFVNWKDNSVEIDLGEHKLKVIIPSLPLEFSSNLYVGGKGKGLFLGFHRDQIKVLEDVARNMGVEPISKRKNN